MSTDPRNEIASGGAEARVERGGLDVAKCNALPDRLQSATRWPPAGRLLSRLEGVRHTGPGTWMARCPAHQDRGPSLSIRELDDGRVLVHDFAGCSAVEVLDAVGLGFADLFPTKPTDHHRPRERAPFPALDILRVVAHEALVVAIAAERIARCEPMEPPDLSRLGDAAHRLRLAALAGGVQ